MSRGPDVAPSPSRAHGCGDRGRARQLGIGGRENAPGAEYDRRGRSRGRGSVTRLLPAAAPPVLADEVSFETSRSPNRGRSHERHHGH